MTNSQDFDRLSAYIDNQLSARERAALAARLSREPELQATLNDLQRTVRALRLLPIVKPPRRFTLTPAMVGARPRREPLFPALRLGAALSALILAVVVAGDFATSGGLASLTANSSQAVVAQVNATAQLELPVGGAAAATPTLELSGLSYPASAETPTENASDAAATPPRTIAALALSPTPEGTDQRSLAKVAPADKTVEPTATLESPELAPAEASATPAPADTQNSARQAIPGGLGPLRVFEIAVAMLAVLLGLGAWFTRRT